MFYCICITCFVIVDILLSILCWLHNFQLKWSNFTKWVEHINQMLAANGLQHQHTLQTLKDMFTKHVKIIKLNWVILSSALLIISHMCDKVEEKSYLTQSALSIASCGMWASKDLFWWQLTTYLFSVSPMGKNKKSSRDSSYGCCYSPQHNKLQAWLSMRS